MRVRGSWIAVGSLTATVVAAGAVFANASLEDQSVDPVSLAPGDGLTAAGPGTVADPKAAAIIQPDDEAATVPPERSTVTAATPEPTPEPETQAPAPAPDPAPAPAPEPPPAPRTNPVPAPPPAYVGSPVSAASAPSADSGASADSAD
jgi:outer membrane biosynthesis protein TonB